MPGKSDNPTPCSLFLKTMAPGENGSDHDAVNGALAGSMRWFDAAIRHVPQNHPDGAFVAVTQSTNSFVTQLEVGLIRASVPAVRQTWQKREARRVCLNRRTSWGNRL
jgi:hypothetical protein